MLGNCVRCYDFDEGKRINHWEFVCSSCLRDEAQIQELAALINGYPDYEPER